MMDGISTADGFVEVNNNLTEMIKYVANEPSVGLYYVQQHTHNALPNLLRLQDRIADRSREATLHTQDSEESIIMVDSMKHCGLSIADDMLNDIKKSLLLMSTSQPKRGVIHASTSGFQNGIRSSGGPTAFSRNLLFAQPETESKGSYFSSVFKSAKQKAVSIKWPQLDPEQTISTKTDQQPSNQLVDEVVRIPVSTSPDPDAEELPSSTKILDEQLEETLPTDDSFSESENYEEFKANKEAKLKEWLEEH
ncbi:Mef2bnb-like protein [Thalictrum thalictroides]|uniref:Mef2bnb-like protein n=1 Tax=Thalictrum thalictroides TaxID=46969 RepID=A0A7J6XDX2_THATH|nr:Mef2bnb-like protein [Thalictrum thalictroides]